MNRGAKRETQHGQAHILPLELVDFFLIRFDLNSILFDFVELRLEKEILLQEDVVGSPETRTSLSGPKRAFEKLLSFGNPSLLLLIPLPFKLSKGIDNSSHK